MELIFSPLAEQDLEEIGDYIALDNPIRAVSFLEQIASQCGKLAEAPERYRLWKELAENIRLCPFRQYLIVFSVQDKQVRIERVLHCARDIKNLVGSSE